MENISALRCPTAVLTSEPISVKHLEAKGKRDDFSIILQVRLRKRYVRREPSRDDGGVVATEPLLVDPTSRSDFPTTRGPAQNLGLLAKRLQQELV
jgi:hypothetical protein